MTWTWLREWMPFIAGVIGGGAVLVGILLGVDAGREYFVRGDLGYVLAIIVCAACFGIGGVLVLINALEAL